MEEHFYLARFLSVCLYTFLSMVTCYRIYTGKRSVRFNLCVFTIILSILSWFFIPAGSMDLYRLWITADEYNRYGSISQIITSVFNSTWSGPLGLLYVIVLSRINKHLVPMITTLLFYGNIFYIISDYDKKHQVSRLSIASIVFFFLSRGVYGEVVSGIRSMLAFSFLARCIYDEVYNKKSVLWNLPLYLVLALFHQTSLIAIAIWLLVKAIIGTKGLKRISLVILIIFTFGGFSFYFGNLLDSVFNSLGSYLTTGGYSYIWEFVFNTFYMIICLFVFSYSSKGLLISQECLFMRRITNLFFGVCVVFINVFAIYHRYISFASFISIPVLIEVIDEKSNSIHSIIPSRNMVILACIMMFLSGLKGNLNGIRFFTL